MSFKYRGRESNPLPEASGESARVLLKDVGLLSDVLTLFLRAVFALQRRRARRQGLRGGQVGAVSFIQFFGSALQVTPHFHIEEDLFAALQDAGWLHPYEAVWTWTVVDMAPSLADESA